MSALAPVRPVALPVLMAVSIQFFRRDDADGCSYWQGQLSKAGYPVVHVLGRNYFAHRLACALWSGPAAIAGKDVHHICEHKDCVNPEHLVPLSPSDHLKVHCKRLACPVPVQASGVVTGREVIAAMEKRPRGRRADRGGAR